MLFLCTALFAQNKNLETIYYQIPPVPDKLLCGSGDNYTETIRLIQSLSVQLEEMKLYLNEKLQNDGDKDHNTMSAGFPTDEDLKKVEKLSEAEQQAFWKKIEANQNQLDKTIAYNKLKYQNEREMLNQKVTDYQNELLAISEELSEIHYAAMKVQSDKRQNIYNTCMKNDSLTAYGKQQIAAIDVEFCASVSPAFLKKLRFEYSNLKQNILFYRRLIVIELTEFSTLNEETVYKQNAALIDLTELEILEQFINNYKDLFTILPGSVLNQG